MAHPVAQTICVTSSEETEQMALWPDVVRDIAEAAEDLNVPDVAKWMKKVLEYNVPGGKKNRSMALIYTYKMLASNNQLTEEKIRLARILAWCVELIQGFILVIDDIEDRSLLRRGKPCWYRYTDIGLAAINDGLMIKSAIFYLIRKHFKGIDCYVNLMETFEDVTLKTIIGQSLDLFSTNFGKKPNLNQFTINRYNFIIEWKTSYYTTVLPITTAMHVAGIKDPEMFKQAKTIALEIGNWFQVQDDYLDCFGDPKVHGKNNTDIQEGKCTWFVVVALQRVTSEQRKILEECYGVSDPEKVRRVKQLFTDLNLQDAYLTYEKDKYNLMIEHIQQISCGLPHSIFLNVLKKLYHRVS